VHLPGSNNDTIPWFTAPGQISTPALVAAQSAEVKQRSAAASRWLNVAFDRAAMMGAPAVVLSTQADMFNTAVGPRGVSGYASVVSTLASRVAAFDRPVLLMTGDPHVFRVTTPLATTNDLYPAVTTRAPRLTQVVVEGEQTTGGSKSPSTREPHNRSAGPIAPCDRDRTPPRSVAPRVSTVMNAVQLL